MIEIKNLYMKYIREYYALYDINMHIEAGECVALVGKENSGKTTLLRVLARLEKFDKGEVYLKEKNLKKLNFKDDVNLGYISLKPVMLENKTIRENLAYVLKERKYNSREIEEKINTVVIEYNLEKYLDKKASSLNTFERYIVAFVRLMLRPLDIILIDNIFDGLLGEERTKILEIVKRFVDQKTTVLVATENEEYFNNIATRVIHFENGLIVK